MAASRAAVTAMAAMRSCGGPGRVVGGSQVAKRHVGQQGEEFRVGGPSENTRSGVGGVCATWAGQSTNWPRVREGRIASSWQLEMYPQCPAGQRGNKTGEEGRPHRAVRALSFRRGAAAAARVQRTAAVRSQLQLEEGMPQRLGSRDAVGGTVGQHALNEVCIQSGRGEEGAQGRHACRAGRDRQACTPACAIPCYARARRQPAHP